MKIGPGVAVGLFCLTLAGCGRVEGTGEVSLSGRGYFIPWWLLLVAAIAIAYAVYRGRRR